MPLIDPVQQDWVAAMKSKSEARLSALRMIKAALKLWKDNQWYLLHPLCQTLWP
jgi:uncharacterized protein YqeY